MNAGENVWRKRLRLSGAITGLVSGGLISLYIACVSLFVGAVGTPSGLSLPLILGIFTPGLIVIVTFLISWRWEIIGGILWILEGILVAVLNGSLFSMFFPVFLSVPLFITGGLFLTSWLVTLDMAPPKSG